MQIDMMMMMMEVKILLLSVLLHSILSGGDIRVCVHADWSVSGSVCLSQSCNEAVQRITSENINKMNVDTSTGDTNRKNSEGH